MPDVQRGAREAKGPVTIYRTPTPKPCNACPFRKKALPGWLGAASPESFIIEISRDHPVPCHQTLDYEDEDWKEKWEAGKTGNTCAGALVMTANMCKLPRDPKFPRMKSDRETVFETPHAFIDYHNSAAVKSWKP